MILISILYFVLQTIVEENLVFTEHVQIKLFELFYHNKLVVYFFFKDNNFLEELKKVYLGLCF